jgi:hypothetical protein
MLTLPFPPSPAMQIQQGFYYSGGGFHGGIDYIKGTYNDSTTWQGFDVISAGPGFACAQPEGSSGCVSGIGNVVLILHCTNSLGAADTSSMATIAAACKNTVNRSGQAGIPFFSYYGHLLANSFAAGLPLNTRNNPIYINTGTKVAFAGASGTVAAGFCSTPCTHLHFETAYYDNFTPFDPYDIGGVASGYPAVNGGNPQLCGPNDVWTSCPPAYWGRSYNTLPAPAAGVISGFIRNASNGQPINNAQAQVQGLALSGFTLSNGFFSIGSVPLGAQTIQFSAVGFSTQSLVVPVNAGANPQLSVALVPLTAGENVTIVLTWGSQPLDLDEHLSGPCDAFTTCSLRFHTYFGSKTPVPYATLDVDQQDGFGPETITIKRDANTNQFVAGEYHLWVHNYSGTPGFSASGGTVVVNQGGSQIASYFTSGVTGDPSSSIWSVAKLTIDTSGNVTLTPVQQFVSGSSATVL